MNNSTSLTNESTRPGETLTTTLVQRDSSGYISAKRDHGPGSWRSATYDILANELA